MTQTRSRDELGIDLTPPWLGCKLRQDAFRDLFSGSGFRQGLRRWLRPSLNVYWIAPCRILIKGPGGPGGPGPRRILIKESGSPLAGILTNFEEGRMKKIEFNQTYLQRTQRTKSVAWKKWYLGCVNLASTRRRRSSRNLFGRPR